MGFSRLKFAGLLTIILLLSASHAAKRHRRKPWINSEQVVSNRERTSNQAHDSQIPTTNHRWEPTSPPTMNVGDLSNAILNAVRPPSRSSHGRPTNRNNRGNQNFRTMPAEPREVNYTMSEIVARFPWITNPSGLSGVTNISRSSDRGHPTSVPTGNRPSDGWTRFNNPQYLRDRFAGLNYDNYGFRPRQGVKTANGKYKVKLSQDWRSLPVYGFDIVMEQENDANLILESADGEFLSGIEEDITSEVPAITKEDAIQKAIDHNMDHGKEIENPSAELIVDTVGDTAILAYLINYFVPGEESVPLDPATQPPPTTTTTTTTTAAPTTTTTFAPVTRFRWRNCNRGRNGRRWGNGGRGRNKWSRRRRCARRPWSRPASRTTVADFSSSRSSEEGMTSSTTSATTSTLPEPLSDAIIEEARDLYKMEETKIVGRRQWVIMNANTGIVYKEWEGLASAMTMSRVSLLVGLHSDPEIYDVLVRKDTETNLCYYQMYLGSQKYLTVIDKNNPGTNFRHTYEFPCGVTDDNDYDITNGVKSPRNSAYKWASEGLRFLRSASNLRIDFHLDVEVHHHGLGAYWNGEKISLGDGDDRYFYPMTKPDIVVHEVAHAFTEHKSRLQYRGQSGSIDEAYADMTACAFMSHFYNDNTDSVYKIGASVSKFGIPLRDMCNPGSPRLVAYDRNHPIITDARDWQVSTGIHNASSLYSKAFCELSKRPGWDIQSAFKVFTMANMVYWHPIETFDSASCGVRKAAMDFRGTNQAVNDVDMAFSSAGIKCRST